MDLALDFLEKVESKLSERDRIAYTTQLLPLLETVISSPLEITAETSPNPESGESEQVLPLGGN